VLLTDLNRLLTTTVFSSSYFSIKVRKYYYTSLIFFPVGETSVMASKNLSLPAEILEQILLSTKLADILQFRRVCKDWSSIIEDSPVLQRLLFRTPVKASIAASHSTLYARRYLNKNYTGTEFHDKLQLHANQNEHLLNPHFFSFADNCGCLATQYYGLDMLKSCWKSRGSHFHDMLITQPPTQKILIKTTIVNSIYLKAYEEHKATLQTLVQEAGLTYDYNGGNAFKVFLNSLELENQSGVTIADLLDGLQSTVCLASKMQVPGFDIDVKVQVHIPIPEPKNRPRREHWLP
jgi:hypothetical protein